MADVKIPKMLGSMSHTYQKAWYKRNKMELPAHLQRASSAGKVDTTRTKQAQQKSLKAYGATKGTRTGSAEGTGEELKDTVKPLTRDQWSKVHAAKRAAEGKPLTKDQRMSIIARTVRKAQAKHDVPTLDNNDAHDDIRHDHDLMHSVGVRHSYNEGYDPSPAAIAKMLVDKHGKNVTKDHIKELESERDSHSGLDHEEIMQHVKKMTESVATAQKVMDRANVVAKTERDPKKRMAAGGLAHKAMLRTINPTGVNTGIVRGGGNKTYRMLTGKVPPYQLTPKTGVSEEVEQVNEMDSEGYRGHRGDEDPGKGPAKYVKPVTTKKTQDDAAKVLAKSFEKDKLKKEEVVIEGAKEDAEKLLGGPVKTRTGNEPKGKLPLGFRQARNLARQAMKAGKSVTESTTEVTEVNEMSHGKALAKMIMAKQSKHPIAQHMGEEQDREYDYEGDMAKSQLKSVITNAQKLHDMLEDDTNLPEWVQLKITLAEDYIVTAANYMDGELDEEVSIDEAHMTDAQMARREKLVKSMKSADWEKRYPGRGEKVMYATATKMAMKEEVEQIDEAASVDAKAKAKKQIVSMYGPGHITHSTTSNGGHFIQHEDDVGDTHSHQYHPKTGKVDFKNVTRSSYYGDFHEQVNEDYQDTYHKHMSAHIDASNAGDWEKAEKHAKTAERAAAMHFKATGKKVYDPGYTGKSKHIAAMKEEVEQVDEKYMGFKAVMAAAKKGGARNPAAVAAAIGRKKYGKEKFQAMAAAGKKKANEEVEGSVPTTPKEKELAAHHGDPNRITFGDVLKARLKSAAAKKMGK